MLSLRRNGNLILLVFPYQLSIISEFLYNFKEDNYYHFYVCTLDQCRSTIKFIIIFVSFYFCIIIIISICIRAIQVTANNRTDDDDKVGSKVMVSQSRYFVLVIFQIDTLLDKKTWISCCPSPHYINDSKCKNREKTHLNW